MPLLAGDLPQDPHLPQEVAGVCGRGKCDANAFRHRSNRKNRMSLSVLMDPPGRCRGTAQAVDHSAVVVEQCNDATSGNNRLIGGFLDAIEEERRLFYVAITRARDELYLSYPHMRLNAGFGDVFQRPSRFLKEIPSELLEDWQVKRS